VWNNVGTMRPQTVGKPKKSASVRVRMDAALKERLEQLALIHSLDLSDIARMAFVSYISRHQRPLM